jgi:hypothetical protein
MTGYNHYPDCECGWCVNYGRGRSTPRLNHDQAYAFAALERYGARKDNFASCFVAPNASCPVCGTKVFFYSNDRGSRVYFDHLGPPWPKHGCTDGRRGFGYWPPKTDHPEMRRRPKGHIDEILENLTTIGGADIRDITRERFQTFSESIFIVKSCAKTGFQCWIFAEELVGAAGEPFGFRFDSKNFEPRPKDICSFDGKKISFFIDGKFDGGRYQAHQIDPSIAKSEIENRTKNSSESTKLRSCD